MFWLPWHRRPSIAYVVNLEKNLNKDPLLWAQNQGNPWHPWTKQGHAGSNENHFGNEKDQGQQRENHVGGPQPFVPYNVHIFKWIEDAYMQYCLNNEESASLGGRSAQHHKISPGKERLLPPPPPTVSKLHRSCTEDSSAQNSVILY